MTLILPDFVERVRNTYYYDYYVETSYRDTILLLFTRTRTRRVRPM